jgi:hypothetical protein
VIPGKCSLFETSMVYLRLIMSTTVMFAGFLMPIHGSLFANRAVEMEGAPFAITQAVWGVQIMISVVVRTLALFLLPSFPLSLDP